MNVFKILPCLAMVASLCGGTVVGQTGATTKNTTSQVPPAATNRVRDRRVAAKTSVKSTGSADSTVDTKGVEPAAKNDPAVRAVDAGANEIAKPSVPAPKSAPSPTNASETAPVAEPQPSSSPAPPTLRDQIDAAANPQERIRLQLKLAEELIVAGKKADAQKELQSIVATDVFDPQGFYNTGNSLARLGASTEAINAYRKAIEQRKGNYSRAFNNLGVILLREGRWDEAHEALRTALKLENFRYAEASYNLGRVFAARGEADLAIREWRRALAVNPDHSAAREAIARIGSEGRIEVESEPSRNTAVTASNRQPAPAKPITNVALPSERPASIKSPRPGGTQKILTVDPISYGFLQQARNASERGKFQEAVESYRHVLSRRGGYFAPANLELSYVLLSLKRNDEALANLLQVANRDGERYPISYYHAARVYEQRGDLKLAEQAFAQTVAAYGTKNSQFLLDLSRVREKQNDFKGALEAMEQYVAAMQQSGQTPTWSDERLAALRQKVTAAQPR